jgi:DNA polymerase-4
MVVAHDNAGIVMRAILHVDMDAFYASVEIRDNPELRDKPIVVGGSSRRGVVAAASYAARKFGVYSAMPMTRALALCPQLIVVPGRMDHYAEISSQVFAIFREVTPLVEGLSLDEAFLDVTASRSLFGDGATIAEQIRARIVAETRLTASAGVATTKFVAKLASDMNKPNGMFVAPEADADVTAFLARLPLRRMWGLGVKSLPRFEGLGLHTFGDLQRADPDWLRRALGDHALDLQKLARGHDPRAVIPERAAKSIGGERTFEDDRIGFDAAWRAVLEQVARVATRMQRSGLSCRTLTLKLREPDFRTHTLRTTLGHPVSDLDSIAEPLKQLLQRHRERAGEAAMRFRLVGVSASALEESDARPALFQDPQQRKRERLGEALLQIQAKSGKSVVRASLLDDPRGK